MRPVCKILPGSQRLLISMPHSGTWIPQEIARHMTLQGLAEGDTDWNLDQLYQFPLADACSRLIANYSRYVIDLNRPPDGTNLYPGQPTPELCATMTFSGQPIYRTPPAAPEIQRRMELYWKPYHQELHRQLRHMAGKHPIAVLLDAHSIASRVPRLFSGCLPDVNIGTNHGRSCDRELERAVVRSLEGQQEFSYVINGRFIGGYITRNYGVPADRIHAVQLELSQATYMDEELGVWDSTKAQRMVALLQLIVETVLQWANRQ